MYIKWFVAAVGAGKSPEAILANPMIFLEFCMSNVYGYLSDDSKDILKVFLSANKELNLAEISYISKMISNNIQSSIQQLIKTNMVLMSNSCGETLYGITEFARKYLLRAHPVSGQELTKNKKRINQLSSKRDFESFGINNRYLIDSLVMRTEHDNAIVSQLKVALKATRANEIEKANEIIEKALILSPGYFEVYRINAFIKSLQASSTEAEIAYKTAIKLAPNQPQIYYHLGCFTQKDLGDSKTALGYFKQAVKLDPDAFDPNYEVARMLLFIEKYEETRAILQKIQQTPINSRQRLLVAYLEMQIDYRVADRYMLESKDVSNSIYYLNRFYCLYKNIPQLDRSFAMKKLLRKSKSLVHSLVFNSTTNEEREKSKQLLESWLDFSGTARLYEHAQINKIIDDSSGYVLLDSNEELYFRKEWFLDNTSSEKLKIGVDLLVIKFKDPLDRLSARYIK